MEATEYSDKKVEREQKIVSLEAEKASLQSEIAATREKVAQLDFERSVRTLQSEIDALRTEKISLEERASAYESETKDTIVNKPSLATIRAAPAVAEDAGQAPLGQRKVEQVRPLRDAVSERISYPQRPPPAAGIPKTAGPFQPQGPKSKAVNEKETQFW